MKIKRIQIIKFICVLAIMLVAGVISQRKIFQIFDSSEMMLNTGWDIQEGDNFIENVDLSEYRFDKINSGDEIVLSKILEKAPYGHTSLRIQSRYSCIKVSLDDTVIYEYGFEYYKDNRVTGNGFHWIELPENYQGRKLTIEYIATENKAFSSIDSIQIMDSKSVMSSLIAHNLVAVIIACCLFALGLVAILFFILRGGFNGRLRMLLSLGGFSIFISVWMICNTRLVEVIYKNLHGICQTEYISMYLACICMQVFVSELFQGKREKQFFRIVAGGFTVVSILIAILNFTNVLHFPKTAFIFQITALFSAVIIIYILVKESRKQKIAEKTFLIGIIFFTFMVILELARYRYNKLCVPAHVLTQSFVPVGALIFILAMAGSFFARIMERVAAEMERKTLYEMAYKDSLTNLKNRAWCEKTMDEYVRNSRPVTIINMDLNDFKPINDTYGHSIGDEMLIRFADILLTVFRGNDCVGRMGGDEFVVIADYAPDDVIEERMRLLNEKLSSENEKNEHPFKLSVAYGYASDSEGGKYPVWKIYEQADKNMYSNKNSFKNNIDK